MMERRLISLPLELLEELDAFAKSRGYTRAEFIRHFIRKFIQFEKQLEVEAGER